MTGLTIWFTGLSGSGKTTLCNALYEYLRRRGRNVEVLDGDVVRQNLSKGLDYSREGREENIRRIGFVARLLTRHGVTVLVAAISPYRAMRNEVRASIGAFLEVYVDCPLQVCEARDSKGLYRKARAGQLPDFTGIGAPYEPPMAPEVVCHTDREPLAMSLGKILAVVDSRVK